MWRFLKYFYLQAVRIKYHKEIFLLVNYLLEMNQINLSIWKIDMIEVITPNVPTVLTFLAVKGD